MKNILIIASLSTLLGACASASPPPAVATPEPQKTRAAPQIAQYPSTAESTQLALAKPESEPETESNLPSLELNPELLFKYLSAEIADQRGAWQSAYVNLLAIAQQTRDPRVARRAAEVALNAKQGEEAMAAVRLWRTLAPESEEAEQYYLGFMILSDDLTDALPVLQARLKQARPGALGAMILQVQRLLARAKNKAAAFALLDQLLQPYAAIPEARLALAQAAFINGDGVRASQEASAALAANPTSELAALTLAQVTPDTDQAIASLSQFLRANPDSREVRLAQAQLLIKQKQYDQARASFEILLKQKPEDLTTLYALGLLGTQSKQYGEAEKYLTTYLRVLEEKPEDGRDATQALLILAQIAEERNDTEAALKWLDQIDSPTTQAYLSAQIRRARLLARTGDVPRARQLLQAVSTNGETERAQLVSAEAAILAEADQQPVAMTVLTAGIKTFPKNVDLLYDHAMMAEKLDQLDVMETSLRKIMTLAPDNQHAYNALGYSLAERNLRLQEAYTLIEKALQLAPLDPFIMDSMGWIQYRLGRMTEAESHLRRAYALRPDPEIAAHLGEVLWVNGQREDAKKLWRTANGMDPGNATLKSTLSRLQVDL